MDFVNFRKNKKSVTIPKGLITFCKVLQFISPNLAAKFGAKLFITPMNFPRPKREEMLYKSAQKRHVNIPSINKEVEVIVYGYSKRKVLFVHGWSGRSTQLIIGADKLLENGLMYIAFDGPAHGGSPGKTTSMPEFVETIQHIAKEFGPFEAAIGHSFGGMCLINAVAAGLPLKKLITIGAADKISEVILDFTKTLQLRGHISEKIKAIYDKRWQKDIDEHASSNQAKNIDIPTLVIHDTFDNDVDVSSATNIRQNLKEGELYVTQGLGHTKMLLNKEVNQKIVNFIKRE